ncbi:hypothetical protein C8R46DRAFT_1027685 [Mycena filopes]|nr:hypothetical protein C8R46DRAFT_1027685 [Mycena filopes]
MSFVNPSTQPQYHAPDMLDQDGEPYQGHAPDQQGYEGHAPDQAHYERPPEQHTADPTPQYVNDLTQMMQLLTENFGAFQSVMANYVQGQANAAAPASTAHTVPNPSAPRGTARVRDPRRFNGKIDEVEPFLNEIEDCVYIQRFALPTDEDKCPGYRLKGDERTSLLARIPPSVNTCYETWDRARISPAIKVREIPMGP